MLKSEAMVKSYFVSLNPVMIYEFDYYQLKSPFSKEGFRGIICPFLIPPAPL
jgi:hypothetical protein